MKHALQCCHHLLLLTVIAGMVGCQNTPAASPLPSTSTTPLTAPPQQLWPESQWQVSWEKDSGPLASRGGWRVNAATDAIVVSASQKRHAQRDSEGLSLDQWDERIEQWRQEQMKDPWSVVYRQPAQRQASSSPVLPPPPVTVFVSADCHLCALWQQQWPSMIPAQWIPVQQTPWTEHDRQWAKLWCQRTSPDLSQSQCEDTIRQQGQRLHAMGIDTTPAVVAHDGRWTPAWPDQAWLVAWWSPQHLLTLPPSTVQEPDL